MYNVKQQRDYRLIMQQTMKVVGLISFISIIANVVSISTII